MSFPETQSGLSTISWIIFEMSGVLVAEETWLSLHAGMLSQSTNATVSLRLEISLAVDVNARASAVDSPKILRLTKDERFLSGTNSTFAELI
jgi:hypothetical protein